MSGDIFAQLAEAVLEGNSKKALELTDIASKEGISANNIIQKGLIVGIKNVGDLFNKGDAFLPELIVSGKAMQAAIDYLKTKLDTGEPANPGKLLIGTVKGDIHDIGKNIVVMMFRSNGWDVNDLGVDISPKQFCEAVKEGNYDVLGLSALLTMTMPNIELTIKALVDMGLREKTKIIIGGAPITQEYADKIGADAYGKDAWEAVTKAETLRKAL